MKCFFTLAAFVAAQQPEYTGKILPDVIGVLPSVEEMPRMDLESPTEQTMSAEYYARRAPGVCDFPLQILILQDVTDSFSDNIAEMRDVQLQKMVDGLRSSHPDSEFAMVSFQDKPIFPLGNRDDACVTFFSDFSTDVGLVKEAYAKSLSYGGADAPENHFGAIFAGLQSSKLSWRGPASEYTRLVVVITDAGPHFEGDEQNVPGLAPFPGSYTDAHAEDICLKYYYPSPPAVRDLIKSKKAYLSSFVYDGDWANGWAARSWKAFNTYLKQTDDFCEQSAEDSSDFWVKLSAVIRRIEQTECLPATTTPTPTSRPSVTVTELPPPVSVTPSSTVTLPPPVTAPTTTTTPLATTKPSTEVGTPITQATTTTPAPTTVSQTITAVDTPLSQSSTTTSASTTLSQTITAVDTPLSQSSTTTSAPTTLSQTITAVDTPLSQSSTTASHPTTPTRTSTVVDTPMSQSSTTVPATTRTAITVWDSTPECGPVPTECGEAAEMVIKFRRVPANLRMNTD